MSMWEYARHIKHNSPMGTISTEYMVDLAPVQGPAIRIPVLSYWDPGRHENALNIPVYKCMVKKGLLAVKYLPTGLYVTLLPLLSSINDFFINRSNCVRS